ncbi:MAG: MFS transporter [Acidobacteria bacterium]|nr:MFS transporter [Acidobacteriota bacterium]
MALTPHEFNARFWSVIAATFLGFLGIGSVLPALAPHVRHDLGGSDQTVGFVIGIFSLIALASRLISGPLTDRRGRKVAFLAGLSSCALAGLAYLLPFGVTSAYLGRTLQGFGEACLYTAAAAWVIELGGIHRSGQSLGYLSSAIWGGISAGPVVGGWLGSFERAAMFQAASALTAILLLLRIPEQYEPARHVRSRNWMPKGLLLAGLSVGFVNVHYPVITGFLVLHLASHGDSGRMAFSAYAGVILFSRLFLGGLPDRMNPRVLFFIGIACMTGGLSLLAWGPPPLGAVFAAGLLGFGFSFPWASVATTMLKRTAEGDRGSLIAVLGAFYDAFVGTSSFAAGFVAHRFGYAHAFVMAAAALGLAAVMARMLFAAEVPEEARAAEEPSLV